MTGDEIRQGRLRRSYSVREAARSAGVPEATWRRAETGAALRPRSARIISDWLAMDAAAPTPRDSDGLADIVRWYHAVDDRSQATMRDVCAAVYRGFPAAHDRQRQFALV